MAKNGKTGDGHREGAIRGRSQFEHPNGAWYKRDAETDRIIDSQNTRIAEHNKTKNVSRNTRKDIF